MGCGGGRLSEFAKMKKEKLKTMVLLIEDHKREKRRECHKDGERRERRRVWCRYLNNIIDIVGIKVLNLET